MTLPLWVLIVGILVILAVGSYFFFASFATGAGYQPTPRRVIDRMLEFADPRPGETLVDLGAGTGAIVWRAVRRYDVRAVAVELEPLRVLFLRLRRALSGHRRAIRVVWENLFRADLSGADIVVVFLWPPAMVRLRAKLERELPSGARVVSHWHPIPGWTPERTDSSLRVYLYRHPESSRQGAPATSR